MASPGVVPATSSRTVLAVGPSIVSLTEPCLAVAREGVLLAFAWHSVEAQAEAEANADAAWRLAARLASEGAVALPLWPEAGDLAGAANDAGANDPNDVPTNSANNVAASVPGSDALVARVIEEFGRLDGVLVIAADNALPFEEFAEGCFLPTDAGPANAAVVDLLRAAARRLGRGEPRVAGQFVVVWRGGAEGLARLREALAIRAADGSCPGAGRHWEMHVTAWPANADEAAARGRELAAWLGPACTAASVPENPAGEKH
jgi:hypothetical protein